MYSVRSTDPAKSLGAAGRRRRLDRAIKESLRDLNAQLSLLNHHVGDRLEQILRQYVGHYNAERPHRRLDLAAPEPPRLRVRSRGPVARRDCLGGLIHEYYRKAA
jgi:hypothetical protein